MFLKFDLVNSSLNSKSWNLEAVDTAFSKVMNNLLTLILSKALGDDKLCFIKTRLYLSFQKVATGFTLLVYKVISL